MISNHPPSEAADPNNGSETAHLSAAVHSRKYESVSNNTFENGHQKADLSQTPGWQMRPGAEYTQLRPRPSNWIRDIMDRSKPSLRAVDARVIISITVALAFGLGWTGGSIFNSASNLQPAAPARKPGLLIAQAHHHEIKPEIQVPASPSKSAFVPAKPNGGSRSIIAPPPGPSPASQLIQERSSLLALLPANMETGPPGSPGPETRPTTLEGWSVRSVNREGAILVGPDRVWTVKPGDAVPDLGRIDTIVRWGNYWVVGTSSGIISSE